jgi:hypothetical protein
LDLHDDPKRKREIYQPGLQNVAMAKKLDKIIFLSYLPN